MSAVRGLSRAISARPLLAALLSAAPAAAQHGDIVGTVRTAGAPVANARAVLDTSRESRTDSIGRFHFREVAAGRHTLSVFSIGATPYSVNLIVAAHDTLDFEVVLVKSVVLDSVIVEGSTVRQGFARAYEDRKRVGLGKYMDSTEVRKFGVVRQALLFIPGIRCKHWCDLVYFTDAMGVLCLPNLWIDNQNWGTDQGILETTRPDDIMGVEAYTRAALIPDEFKARGIDRGCGALVVWTRRLWPPGKRK
jgi:hypothetical protein